MRILRVAQKVYPDVKGGGPYHVHAMSRDQAAMGHDVTVVTVGDGPRTEERDGYTVVRCPSRGSVLGNDVAPGVAWHLLAADAYDVVHAHAVVERDITRRRRVLLILIVTGGYGVGMEAGQALLPARYFAIDDLVANTVGVLFSLVWFVAEPWITFVHVSPTTT